MRLPTFRVTKATSKKRFIKFWAATYRDAHEDFYERNIGKPLTKKRVEQLYLWKNSGKPSKKKCDSVANNYVAEIATVKKLSPATSASVFLTQFGGGMIWRIFFLHVWQPAKFPIFDQHVFRAMRYIKTGKTEKLPSAYGKVRSIYVDEYIDFHKSFPIMPDRLVDKALWSFGKFLKSQYRSML